MGLSLSNKIKDIQPSKTLAVQEKIIKLRQSGKEIISFTVGEPNFFTPENIKNAGIEAIQNNKTKYTAVSGIQELKLGIANKLNIENNLNYHPENIIVTNGGKQAIVNALLSIINPGDEIIIPAPYWLSYTQMVKLCGGTPVIINTKSENKYKMTASDLKSAISTRTKAVIINSPNNPTGAIYSRAELTELSRVIVENKIYVISDEIYEYLNYTDRSHTSIGSLNDDIFKQTITINGFSKAYAMTGWRLGYMAAPENIIKYANKIQGQFTSNVCTISQYAGLSAIQPNNLVEVEKMVQAFKLRKELIISQLSKVPYISYVEPEGAFYVMVDMKKIFGLKYGNIYIKDINDFVEILLNNYGVAVIPCEDFGAPTCIRLSYALGENDIVLGVNKIRDLLMELKWED